MNQNNETKLDLVNPLSPNQIIKTEILTQNMQQNIENNNQNNLNQGNIQQPINVPNQDNIQQPTLDQPINVSNQNSNGNKPKKKNNLLLIILLLITLIVVGGGVLFFIQKNKNNTPSTPNNNVNNNQNNNLNNQDVTTYQYDIKDKDGIYINDINDKFSLRLFITNDSYELYINDKFILNDRKDDYINFYMVDDNLIYINNVTDVRSEHVYIIDQLGNINEIYQLDNINGMVPNNIKINKDSIVINGTRLSHDLSIIYNNATIGNALVNDSSTWGQYGISEDTIIEAIYTYKFENGILNLQPTISNEISLKDYLRNNEQ